jgi:hypothetical protein
MESFERKPGSKKGKNSRQRGKNAKAKAGIAKKIGRWGKVN